MASTADVERALRSLAKRLAAASPEPGSVPDRTVLCVLTDLDSAFWAHLKDARLRGLRRGEPGEDCDVRISARSDDLIALIEGRMSPGPAFLLGRIRIDAPASDLLAIRRLF